MEYTGSCECGSNRILATLPKPIESYEARACQCDFCVPRGAAYLSDPAGTLFISASNLKSQSQGAGLARFWVCQQCDSLVAVTYDFEGKIKGALSISALSSDLQTRIKVTHASPHLLSAEVKTQRWRSLWMDTIFELPDTQESL
ncbi:hypothetical protein [Vibrio nigripulchritudo]|uniref:hypothetical protein n=1 Tax=Vibrio nigripulchritudo TaxID=28173 RepID=UPI0003B23539|nr:hypothetical protein [Vibrio nigripulchritudo]CCN69383.1 conserved hypothetical protein [Vibrio nigripulchritudo SFn118]